MATERIPSEMSNANGIQPFIEQNIVVPLTAGGTLGYSLATSSVQVLPQTPQTRRVTFHNPGSITIYVCQALDANGSALTPGAHPGNWAIYGGGMMTFTGDGVAGAWLATSASGSGNPLTVAASQTL